MNRHLVIDIDNTIYRRCGFVLSKITNMLDNTHIFQNALLWEIAFHIIVILYLI